MTPEAFYATCQSLPASTHVVQWGGADVWKVGGKVYAIGGWSKEGAFGVTFKVSELVFEVLRDQPGCRPAPYLASRGMKWIQRHAEGPLSDEELADLIGRSHSLIAAKLPKRIKAELGLEGAG